MNTVDLARLYAEHGDAVRAVLVRLVGPVEAEDLMQEVFVKAGAAVERFRGEADPRTWLHRIARNSALDHLRSRGHRERMRTDPLAAPGSDAPVALALAEPPKAPADLQRSDMNRCIADYLRQLRPEYGEMLRLKDIEGRTSVEIAAQLGITLEATKIRLHRARAALRRALEQGCEFYRNEEGVLSCDVAQTGHVSLPPAISSKEMSPTAAAQRSRRNRRKTSNHTMSTDSSCGCAAPQSPASATAVTGFSPAAAEYAALGAAIGANCEPCLRFHVREALKVGLSLDDIARAIEVAERVKATPASAISKLAERLTHPDASAPSASSECGCGHRE